jgi:hypothetical protein
MPYNVKTAINDFLSMNHQLTLILERSWQSLDEAATRKEGDKENKKRACNKSTPILFRRR